MVLSRPGTLLRIIGLTDADLKGIERLSVPITAMGISHLRRLVDVAAAATRRYGSEAALEAVLRARRERRQAAKNAKRGDKSRAEMCDERNQKKKKVMAWLKQHTKYDTILEEAGSSTQHIHTVRGSRISFEAWLNPGLQGAHQSSAGMLDCGFDMHFLTTSVTPWDGCLQSVKTRAIRDWVCEEFKGDISAACNSPAVKGSGDLSRSVAAMVRGCMRTFTARMQAASMHAPLMGSDEEWDSDEA